MPYFVATPVVAHVVSFLSLVASLCCLAAEFKRARVRDLKLDGNLCSLPGTPAFGLGIASIACLFVAQILGTSVSSIERSILSPTSSSRSHGGAGRQKRAVPLSFLVFSWVVFCILLILLGTASSMNNGQPYGRGWLDGECYVVRRGVYLACATLILAMALSILGYMFTGRDVVDGGQPNKLSKAEASQKIEIVETGS